MDYLHFERSLQYQVLNGLSPKKRSINYRGRLLINHDVFNRLKSFGVTGRYKPNTNLTQQFILRRQVGATDYCSTTEEVFFVRIGRQKSIKVLNSQYNGFFLFSFQFIRYEFKC